MEILAPEGSRRVKVEAELVADALEELGYNELRYRAVTELRRLIAANRHCVDLFNQLKEDFDSLKASFEQQSAGHSKDRLVDDDLEELLGRYWDLAYTEGKTGESHGDEANEVLHKVRQIARKCQ